MKIKIGDRVRHSISGGQKLIGCIEAIEVCCDGEKYGEAVDCADTRKQEGTVDLDNGHWCYFYQVLGIVQ